MAAGENVSALGRELGVRRKLFYQWRDTVRRGGVEALRDVGRPPGVERLARMVERPPVVAPPGVAAPDELARARAQIAVLERKIGQQALELDFFGQALQLGTSIYRSSSVFSPVVWRGFGADRSRRGRFWPFGPIFGSVFRVSGAMRV
jgi:transposase-like protein